jgi:hypothetical protein
VYITSSDPAASTASGYNFNPLDAGIPYVFTAADAGTHTFAVVLKTATPAGTVWSVTAADASNAAWAGTLTNFEVVNAAAAEFVLNAPTNATAGSPFTVKLTVLDAYGNRVKNYFGTVHLTGIAGVPDYTFTADDAEVHIFTLTTTTTGNVNLWLTDVTNPLLTATATVSVKTASTGGGGGGSGGGGGGKTA